MGSRVLISNIRESTIECISSLSFTASEVSGAVYAGKQFVSAIRHQHVLMCLLFAYCRQPPKKQETVPNEVLLYAMYEPVNIYGSVVQSVRAIGCRPISCGFESHRYRQSALKQPEFVAL